MGLTEGRWKKEGLEITVIGRGIIAPCPTVSAGGVMECVSNACLIMAAPDLLTACKRFLSALKNTNPDAGGEMAYAEKLAKAAITKYEKQGT